MEPEHPPGPEPGEWDQVPAREHRRVVGEGARRVDRRPPEHVDLLQQQQPHVLRRGPHVRARTRPETDRLGLDAREDVVGATGHGVEHGQQVRLARRATSEVRPVEARHDPGHRLEVRDELLTRRCGALRTSGSCSAMVTKRTVVTGTTRAPRDAPFTGDRVHAPGRRATRSSR